jgi:hypothetical protein
MQSRTKRDVVSRTKEMLTRIDRLSRPDAASHRPHVERARAIVFHN